MYGIRKFHLKGKLNVHLIAVIFLTVLSIFTTRFSAYATTQTTAIVIPDCGPTDGPAFHLVIQDEAEVNSRELSCDTNIVAPFIEVQYNADYITTLADNKSIQLLFGDDMPSGSSRLCTLKNCRNMKTKIQIIRHGNEFEGTYYLKTNSTRIVKFQGKICPRKIICG